jgi:hypothetical protein
MTTTPDIPAEPVRYHSWSDVPDTFLTKTLLAKMDLPRRPGGPVRARVDGEDMPGHKAVLDLYALAESVPSPASIRQLEAARARGSDNTRRCTHCSAKPELPCTVYEDGQALCRACRHIRRLRTTQTDAAQHTAAERAAALLARENLAIVHVEITERGTTPAGARRPPSAARVVALGPHGASLCDVTMRLVGPRSAGIPTGAVSPQDAAARLAVLTDRVLLEWEGGTLAPVSGPLRAAGRTTPFPTGYGTHHALRPLALAWRADIDPRTRRHRPPTPPGRADRMLWLLQQIAADHQPAHPPED